MKKYRLDPAVTVISLLIAIAIPALVLKMSGDAAPSYQNIEVYLHESGETVTMSLEEYTARLVAVYEDIYLPDDALCSLAVALRTSALLCGEGECGHSHCDDSSHSLALANGYSESTASAVSKTAGQVLVCGGSLVPAALHRSSYLVTESAYNLTGIEIPCLVSVTSPEIIEPEYIEVSGERARMTLNVHFGVDFSAWRDEITVTRDNAGRAVKVTFCGETVGGEAFAGAFGLRSECFTVEKSDAGMVITVYGDGNGLGMSVEGARKLALDGLGYEEILVHYYPGSEVTAAGEVLK